MSGVRFFISGLSKVWADEGLALETSASQTLYAGYLNNLNHLQVDIQLRKKETTNWTD